MTIEQILALLQAKFEGVRKDGLAQIARTIVLQATTEEEAQGIIDKLDPEKVKAVVKDFRKDVDKEVSDARQKIESKYKANDPEGGEGGADPGKNGGQNHDPNDISAIVKAAVSEAVRPFQEKLSAIEGKEVSKSRRQRFEEAFKDVPEGAFRTSQMTDFDLIVDAFNSEDDFDAYLTRKQSDIAAYNQERADSGLGQHGRPMFGNKKTGDGISSATAAFIADQTGGDNPLGGREV